ncbi:integral membrane protein [Neisseria gonorrhoeae]|uniref:Integral membrane protein n=1 Tax=Neisseria gonorrhoeae TaxID=485 RepID=A0A378VWX6_NEIGO|nr:integral membrane protein [Neisseria gonorrhoeae]
MEQKNHLQCASPPYYQCCAKNYKWRNGIQIRRYWNHKTNKSYFSPKKDTSLTTPEGTTLLSGGTLTLSNTGISLSGTTSVFEKGTFTNGGIITLANQSYADKLTIEGNYVGKDGVLKVNTEWNSPGDDQGGNSQSDLLEITGDASGKTTVISVGKDGKEILSTARSANFPTATNAVPPLLRFWDKTRGGNR